MGLLSGFPIKVPAEEKMTFNCSYDELFDFFED